MSRCLLLPEGDNSSHGPTSWVSASGGSRAPACLHPGVDGMGLRRRWTASLHNQTVTLQDRGLLTSPSPASARAQIQTGRSVNFCRKKKRAHISQTSPGYYCSHLTGEATEAQGAKGRGPEGGRLWFALPSTSYPDLADDFALLPWFPCLSSRGWPPAPGAILPFPLYLASMCLTPPLSSRQSRTKQPLTFMGCLCVLDSPDLEATPKFISSFCNRGDCGTERLGTMPRVTQLLWPIWAFKPALGPRSPRTWPQHPIPLLPDHLLLGGRWEPGRMFSNL